MKYLLAILLLLNIYREIYAEQPEELFYKLYKRFCESGNNSCDYDLSETNIQASPLNYDVPTIFIIPACYQTANSDALIQLRNELLQYAEYNIIFVDWSNFNDGQPESARIRTVAVHIADFVEKIFKCGSFNNIHMIGFAAGAHLAGFIGKELYRKSPALTLARITGLDPSSDGFQGQSCEHRLDKSDATFVDVVHTCTNKLGLDEAIGTVDFYINGGIAPQPGCYSDEDGICSHMKALTYYTNSINRCHWKAYSCLTKKNFAIFGFHCPVSTTGCYCFSTKKKCKSPIKHKIHCQQQKF